jgi:protein SCO1/2
MWVVDTIFTRCDAICPTLTSGMKQIQSALKLDEAVADQVMLVSISIDGGYDTPEVLKTFADAYKADPERWRFLTGEREAVWPFVQNGLKLPVEDGGPNDDMAILHSGKLVLIDRAGVVRGYYDGLTDAGRIELLVDLRRLLKEE